MGGLEGGRGYMRGLEGGRGYMGDLKEEKAIWGDLKEEGACDERNWKKEEGCVCVCGGGGIVTF